MAEDERSRCAARPNVRWVRIPQGQKWAHLSEVPPEFQFVERPALWWATGVFYVNADGSLKIMEHDYDTSD